jgi:hypothetical protein
MPGPPHPQPRVQNETKHTSVVAAVTPDSPGIPARNGFNGCFVLSPAIGLSCYRHLRICSADLTPASRRQDHTTSPSAAPVYAKGFDGH